MLMDDRNRQTGSPATCDPKVFFAVLLVAAVGIGLFLPEILAWLDQTTPGSGQVALRPQAPALPPPVVMEPAGPPTAPIRDLLLLAMAAVPTFLAVLACYVDVVVPARMIWTSWRSHGSQPAPNWRQCMGAAILPAIAQPALRSGVLVAGMVAIALWHMGTDAFQLLRSLMMAGAMMTLTIGIMAGFVLARPMGIVRAMLNAVAAYVMFGFAMDAAEWGVIAESSQNRTLRNEART